MKTDKKTVTPPMFESEAQEARWWAANPDYILAQFESAKMEGKLGQGSVTRRGITPTTTIRLDPGDIRLAKMQAEKRGLKYQTYLKMLIHQALVQEPSETKKASSKRS